jgi:filamentous hemagglutinin family protein
MKRGKPMSVEVKIKNSNIRILFFMLCCLQCISAKAEVIFDGSAGPSGTLLGPTYNIDAASGTQAGNNLFHSFETFNINTGETANFNGPANVTNVIGRVTGGTYSNIDGTINNNIAGANLWLINSAGIVFGENATLNASGSFHASTGESVLFDDGSSFDTVSQNDPSLIISNPEGFGFVSANPSSIFVNNANLSVDRGQTISLVGGDVTLSGSTLDAVDGRLNIVATKGPGDVTFTDPVLPTDSGITFTGASDSLAEINVLSTTLDTSGSGGGAIYIKGGQFVLDPNSSLINNNISTDGNGIHINANDITLNEGKIESISSGSGNGGDIVLQGNNLIINYSEATSSRARSDTGLITEATGSGNGGKVDIDVSNLVKLDGGVIRTFAEGVAQAGDIDINASGLQVVNDGEAITDTLFNGGTGGSINISTTNSVFVSGSGSRISAETSGNVSADNIDINITTDNLIITDGAQISTDSFSVGLGAGINIVAENMTVSNQGVVNARTFDDTGAGIDIDLTNNLIVTSDGSISTDTFNNGDGSNINVTATNVGISDGGQISASTKRDGQAGAITITANNSITIAGALGKQTGVFSVAGGLDDKGEPDPIFQDKDYFGVGGDINLTADKILFENGAIASSEAINLGNAGNILLNAADKVELTSSTLQTSADRSAGGNITIKATRLINATNSQITAEAFGVSEGNDGGNISIDPINVVLNSSDVIARANAGNGGNITIVATAFVRSADSDVNASSKLGVDGEVLIETLNQNVNVIPVVNESYLDVVGFLSNPCAAQALKGRSSFTVELYKSASASPADFSEYQYLTDMSFNSSLSDYALVATDTDINLACK